MAFLYVPNGKNMADWTPKDGGRRLRAARHPRAAAPVQGRPARPDRPDRRQGPRPRRRRRRPRPGLVGVPHRLPAAQDRRRRHPRRHLRRSGGRRPHRRPDPAAVARNRLRARRAWPATATRATAASTPRPCPGARPRTPLPKEVNPRLVFERLFGSGPDADRAAARRQRAAASSTSSAKTPASLHDQARRQRSAQARRVFHRRPRHRAAHRAGREAAAGAGRPNDRSPTGIPAKLSRSTSADVRPAGAGLPGRRDARLHLRVRQRGQQQAVPVHRRLGGPPRPVAPRQQRRRSRPRSATSTASTSRSSPTC